MVVFEPGGDSNKAVKSPSAHPAAAAAAAATANAETSSPPNQPALGKKNGVPGTDVPGGNRSDLLQAPAGCPRRRRHAPGTDVPTRALQLRPLDSGARGNPRRLGAQRGSTKLDNATIAPTMPTLAVRQGTRSTAGCLPEVEDGNGYWDLLGRRQGGSAFDDGVEAVAEQTESAVGSVVLLRWAVECFLGNEDDGIAGEPPLAGEKVAALAEGVQEGRVPAVGTSAAAIQGRAMNATVSGPVHLMHSERKPRDSDLFSFSDPPEGGSEHSENGSSSPRQGVNTPFAATSPTPVMRSRSHHSESLADGRPLSRGLRLPTGEDDGGKRRSQAGSDKGHSASNAGLTSSNPKESAKNAAGGEERYGGKRESTDNMTVPTRYELAGRTDAAKCRAL